MFVYLQTGLKISAVSIGFIDWVEYICCWQLLTATSKYAQTSLYINCYV